jgi:putative DNA primase/helicase|nr:MAG TPA: dsDNA helicase [Caudoviricetes sp.]
MNRRELKDYVLGLLSQHCDEYASTFRDISLVTSNPERTDRYGRRLEGLFREGYGVVTKDIADYRVPLYVFTGKIYEYMDYNVLYDAVDRWLEKMGVAARDRTNKIMYSYMNRIINVIRDHELQPDLSIMCFTNCVVDMNTLKTYPHSPKFDCVKMYPFKYDRKEIFNCPTWRSFLGESWIPTEELDGVLPEKHKRRILQMFLGACLVNRKNISFEYFLILQGTGANGKSVIYRVLKDMFGEDEILNIKMSQFARGGDEQLRAAYSMSRKRLMYCTESNRGDFKDMSIIKAISSGEPIACRGIGGNITMMQRPPIMLCNSNYRWQPKDFLNRDDPDDESMQRRALVLNFDKTIPVEKRDTMLAERMKAEHAGIMAWIVKGLCELKKNNWRMPENLGGKIDLKLERIRSSVTGKDGKLVDGSISEYFKYKECQPEEFEGSGSIELTSSDIYKNYERFCKKNGVVPVSQRKLGIDMLSLGYAREKRADKGYSNVYTLWCGNEDIVNNFMRHIPNIAEEAKTNLFEGWEYSDEDFLNED